MRLSDVLPADIELPPGADSIQVTGITAASAAVGQGAIFAGLPGSKVDGAAYVPEALARGARAIIVGKGKSITVPEGVALLEVDNPRAVLAKIAAKFAGRQPRCAVAVTGTSGKTSVADFTRQIFTSLGYKAASLGTIGIVKPDGAVYGSLTTPDPVTLHATLAALADEGVTHLAFEASSHGLDQNRLDGVELTAAAFTNLGRDHMDYHATFEDYLGAKLRLFTDVVASGGVAVVNSDAEHSDAFIAAARKRDLTLLTVGETGEAIRLKSRQSRGDAQALGIVHDGHSYNVLLPLAGAFQASNALVAAGLAIGLGEDAENVFAALAHLKGAPGRMEKVAYSVSGAPVYVDYAHTPDSL